MSVEAEELVLAESIMEIHGARAIAKVRELRDINAGTGNREAAAKWMRVLALIEYSDLRTTAR